MAESERFRRELAGVLGRWVADELVTREQAAALRAHYDLDSLDDVASSRFVQTILVLGGVLIGLGILSFVAANWEAITPAIRALGCVALMLVANGVGYRLWVGGRHPRWGSLFLLVGTFLLGGSIALMAQWFQVDGDGSGLFLGWGLGALAMAWGLLHTGVGCVAALVWLGLTATEAYRPYVPLMVALGLVPLAYRTRSGVLLGVTLAVCLVALMYLASIPGPVAFSVTLLAVAIGTFALAQLPRHQPVWQEALEKARGENPDDNRLDVHELARIAERVSLLILACLLVGWGFRDSWVGLDPIRWFSGTNLEVQQAAYATTFYAVLGLFVALRVGLFVPGARLAMLAPVLPSALLLMCLLASPAFHSSQEASLPALLVNVALAGFALHQAWEGLTKASRLAFWFGVGLLSLQVACRFFEFHTGLIWKSLAFVTWGMVIIGIGVWFERMRARRKQAVAAAEKAA